MNQIGRPRPPAVNEIKIFDNDSKATKHSFSLRMFCGLVIIIKNFNFINSRRHWLPNLILHLFHPGLLVLGRYFFYTMVFWLRSTLQEIHFPKHFIYKILIIYHKQLIATVFQGISRCPNLKKVLSL